MNFFSNKRSSKAQNDGFTLIELLVAVGMFALLMTMIVSALLTMIYTNRKGQALSLVTTNLDFALESMTRYIRIGYDYDCVGASAPDCVSGSDEFHFTSPIDVDGDLNSPDDVRFRFDNNAVERQVNSGAWIPLTGADIIVDTTISKFYVTGAFPNPDTFQPKVVIVLRATANVLGQTTTFNLQTTATQRIPDN